MSKIHLAINHGFKKFKNSSILIEEMKKQIQSMWILFAYTDDQGDPRQSFALIEVIIDDISVPKNERILTYHSDDFLSEEFIAFDEENDEILYYQILEDEQFDVKELEFFKWECDEKFDGKILYFRIPITKMDKIKQEVFLGWADFENNPQNLELYTASLSKLVDVNEHTIKDIYFSYVPFLSLE